MRIHLAYGVVVLGVLAGATLGCPATTQRTTGAASSTSPAEEAVSENAPIRVIHRGTWGEAGVHLLGVDRARHRAFLRLEHRDAPLGLSIDTVDCTTGQRVEHWEATHKKAKRILGGAGDVFHAMDGSFDHDLVRLADMVSASGPFHTHSSTWVPRVAATTGGTHILFSALSKIPGEGVTLMVADRDGRSPLRVGALTASFDPVLSHDGSNVVFRGCTGTPCRGSLYIAGLGAPESLIEVPIDEARDFAWSADGTTIYTVGTASKGAVDASDPPACVYQVPAAGGGIRPLYCATGSGAADETKSIDGFVEDPSSNSGVVATVHGPIGAASYDYRWMKLPGGAPLATRSVSRATGVGILSSGGVLVVPTQGLGLEVVDLASGRAAHLGHGVPGEWPHGDGVDTQWSYSDLDAQWLDDHTFLALRSRAAGKYELVSIDTTALLSTIPLPAK